MTHMTLQAVRQLIANDSYAITFQSIEQYRATLLRHFDILVDGAPPFATGGVMPGALNLAGEGLQPLPAHAGTGPRGAAVTLDEAVYALDLVVNKMHVPGLSGQRAFALDVLKRADAPAGVLANAAWVHISDPRDCKLAELLATAPSAHGTPEAPAGWIIEFDGELRIKGANRTGIVPNPNADSHAERVLYALGRAIAAQIDGGQGEGGSNTCRPAT